LLGEITALIAVLDKAVLAKDITIEGAAHEAKNGLGTPTP